jgi:hypothetical protein
MHRDVILKTDYNFAPPCYFIFKLDSIPDKSIFFEINHRENYTESI